MERIVLAKIGGDWVAGKFERKNNDDWLKDPRLYLFNGKEHGFMNLPGNPDILKISAAYFHYDLAGQLGELYESQVLQSKLKASGLILPGSPTSN